MRLAIFYNKKTDTCLDIFSFRPMTPGRFLTYGVYSIFALRLPPEHLALEIVTVISIKSSHGLLSYTLHAQTEAACAKSPRRRWLAGGVPLHCMKCSDENSGRAHAQEKSFQIFQLRHGRRHGVIRARPAPPHQARVFAALGRSTREYPAE